MPELGELKKGVEIGKYPTLWYSWLCCPDCGTARWMPLRSRNGKPWSTTLRCRSCFNRRRGMPKGSKSKAWRGGRQRTKTYIGVWVDPSDFFHPMASKRGTVPEHRLVMARHLGRCLAKWEIVHHINGDSHDNRLENLQLVTDMQHKQITKIQMRIATLQKRVTLLEAENEMLNLQLKGVT